MADYSCAACEDLRQTDPNFVVNGLTDTECTSLGNDTGLNPSKGHNDCTDLNDMNDCLVKNMEDEINSYNVCSWKTYMKALVNNLWTMFKGIICAICGIWTNIHNIMSKIDQLICIINSMGTGTTFEIDEEPSGGSYIVAGKGCSFYTVSGSGPSQHASDITLEYVAGGLGYLDGSCIFHTQNFTDARSCVNFDNGDVERTSTSRLGNSVWAPVATSSGGKKTAVGGELVYEIRIKKSEYPQLKKVFQGRGMETSGGAFHAATFVFDAGEYAWGQHGWCHPDGSRYTGYDGNYDAGHLVPSGWLYIQCRISYINYFYDTSDGNGHQFTPVIYMGMRMNPEDIPSC